MSFTRSKSAVRKPRRVTSTSRAVGSRKSSSNGAAAERAIPDGQFTKSCGNVFEDLGFPPDVARNLQLQSDLGIWIERIIARRKLTQAQAARLFQVTQPRMSDLMRGKLQRFSIDMLLKMLTRAGVRVDLIVDPKAA